MTPGFSDAGSVLPTDKTAAEEREKAELANNSDVEQDESEENFEEGDTEEDATASETEENTEKQSPGNTKNQENKNETADSTDTEDSSSGTFLHSSVTLRLIRMILICVSVIGLAALARLLCLIIKKRIRAYHDFAWYEIQKQHYRRAIICINRRIYRKAGRGKRIGGQQLTDRKYEKLLCSTFPEIPSENWNCYMKIAKKAAFSADEPCEEEARFCAKIYDEILIHNLREKE
jgi:hypothetical protein